MIKKLYKESRRDDIIAARDKYRAEKDKRIADYEVQETEYKKVLYTLAEELEALVKETVGDTTIDLEIYAEPWGGHFGAPAYKVSVKGDERKKFDNSSSLSWDWSVTLDRDGDVVKESGSWSGLRATTKEQLNNLRETLRVLEILNDMDWGPILHEVETRRPKESDYITLKNPRWEKDPDFISQLKQATIEDAIGDFVLVKGIGNKVGDSYHGSYYIIHNQTPKQTTVTEVSAYQVDKAKESGKTGRDLFKYIESYGTDYRMATNKFMSLLGSEPEIIDLR